ncbi:methylmalonate-semialdehyde dehydrogenase [Aspergillus udagawae]|uniref:methylmalonate-semialdehyde dehydrogenase (CoA acylating) n=1 Tax=Aspergillus udagawae TaxID=91492 RepID=A0ABQ1B3G0_9EURO|nr:methylmalonate-semialdehyde dehydrogenase [Aspergillus udagawae]
MGNNTAGTASTVSRLTHDLIVSPTDSPNFIDNEFVLSKSTQWTLVHDPATNNLVTRVPQSTAEELSAAQILFRFTRLIRDNWDRLAAAITLEQGKTFTDSRGDVLRGLQVAETACGITTQLTGEVLEVARDMETRSYREPLGVVAAICPFNFPAMIPLWCIPIAVVTGNTMILKPSERVPGASLILAELAREAGFPKGVLNLVHGSVDTVNFILNEPAIRAISFRVQANLGAKNHAVLLPDVDKGTALNALVGAAFGAAGQRCMALSVLVTVGESSKYIPELVEKARGLVVSAGFDQKADVGPVISPESKARIESLIASAERDGATIVLDGRGYQPENYPNGNFVAPTVITDVKPHMACYKEELFGPVLVCLSVDTLEEAVQLLNANEYGNGASIFTQSGSSAAYFQKNVEAGQVGINVAIPVPLPMFSFTGNKKSIAGGGANTFYGKPGLAFYTQQKTVTSLWRRENIDSGKKQVVMPSHL